jgi:hypothetical protein
VAGAERTGMEKLKDAMLGIAIVSGTAIFGVWVIASEVYGAREKRWQREGRPFRTN